MYILQNDTEGYVAVGQHQSWRGVIADDAIATMPIDTAECDIFHFIFFCSLYS